jgi:hypothetical protein
MIQPWKFIWGEIRLEIRVVSLFVYQIFVVHKVLFNTSDLFATTCKQLHA